MKLLAGVCIAISVALPAAAHEFWLAPNAFAPAPDTSLEFSLKVGQDLQGAAYPYRPDKAARFDYVHGTQVIPVAVNIGADPAGTATVLPGLGQVVYQSGADLLHYSAWENFIEYLGYEGLDFWTQAHIDRGLPQNDFIEAYYRMAKTLVQTGPVRPGDADRAIGMPLELVADGNPYARAAGEAQSFTLMWRKAPLPDHPVSVFWRDGSGTAQRELMQTDADGRVDVTLRAGMMLLNSVQLMVPPEGFDADWISAWASLTFEVSRG